MQTSTEHFRSLRVQNFGSLKSMSQQVTFFPHHGRFRFARTSGIWQVRVSTCARAKIMWQYKRHLNVISPSRAFLLFPLLFCFVLFCFVSSVQELVSHYVHSLLVSMLFLWSSTALSQLGFCSFLCIHFLLSCVSFPAIAQALSARPAAMSEIAIMNPEPTPLVPAGCDCQTCGQFVMFKPCQSNASGNRGHLVASDGHGYSHPWRVTGMGYYGMGTGAKISPHDNPVPVWADDGYVTDHINVLLQRLPPPHAHSTEYNVDTRQHKNGRR